MNAHAVLVKMGQAAQTLMVVTHASVLRALAETTAEQVSFLPKKILLSRRYNQLQVRNKLEGVLRREKVKCLKIYFF